MSTETEKNLKFLSGAEKNSFFYHRINNKQNIPTIKNVLPAI